MATPMPPARPFWAGLDPDKPEPLDKVLAALHCHQVSPPSAADAFYFEFTVNREDHHRIDNGFPELQELSGAIRGSRDVLKPSIPFEFDPSTGKLATMAASMYVKAMDNVSSKCSRVIENGLESLGQLDKPIGQLALAVELMHHGANGGPAARVALHTTIQHKIPTCLIIFFNGNHEGASKYAQLITEHPEDTHTVVAVQLGLPGRLDSERKLQRLAQKSFVSVFTMVGGAVKTVVQQEPLSTPGGGVKLWLSDLVKERESLSGKFVRPLDVRANHHQPNITIPYTTIVTTAIKAYHFCSYDYIDRANSTAPSSSIMSGSSKRPSSTLPRTGLMSDRGKQSLSTLAGRLVANGVFRRRRHAGNKQQHLSTFTPQQSPSIHTGEDAVKEDRPVVAPEGHQRALGTAALPGGRIPLLATSPIKAMIAPWMRLLARLPRKW